MHSKKMTAMLAVLMSGGLLTACEDGTDVGAGTPVTNITIDNSSSGGAGGSGGSGGSGNGGAGNGNGDGNGNGNGNGNGDGSGDTFVGAQGSQGNGATDSTGTVTGDSYSVADWFAGMSATPPLNNSNNLDGAVNAGGFPTGTGASLTASFTAPTNWPPATATDAASLPVPAYITSTNYIGAYDPSLPRDQQYTAGWTIKVEGNDAVWGRNVSTAPVADGTCPAGTTVLMDGGAPQPFSAAIGALADDEEGLFTGAAATGDYDICVLPGRFDAAGTINLTADNVYALGNGFPGTVVGNGNLERTDANFALTAVTLNVQAGTLIYGSPQEALIVSRGATLNVNGTAAAPVVMTSLNQLQSRFDGDLSTNVDTGRGEWAGLALMGTARSNQCAAGTDPNDANNDYSDCDVSAEGNVGFYGGDDDNHDIGDINYLVLRHAGNDIDGNGNELNAITYFSVGRASSVQHVQIHRGFDDGFEWFGGNVFVKNIVMTGVGDDSLDADSGWTGGAQNVLIIQENDAANRGIESDSRFAQVPVTFPLFANLTIIGPANRTAGNLNATEGQAVLHREGIRVQTWNSIVMGDYPNGCLDLDNAGADGTFGRANEAGGMAPEAPGPHLVWRNSFVDCDPADFTLE